MGVVLTRTDRTSAMGATVFADGTGFRTWAPNAHAVSVVAGDRLIAAQDPAWRPDASEQLASLGDGTWGGFLAGVGDGAPYMLYVDGIGGSGWKRDSVARELTITPAFPDSFCIVRDPASYPWHDQGWRPPQFSDLIIYQLHIGTWWAQDATGQDVRATNGGTFLDAADKLGYLRDLGVTAVQLLPVQEFETEFGLGYNGVDYSSPEGQYVVPPSAVPARLTRGQPGARRIRQTRADGRAAYAGRQPTEIFHRPLPPERHRGDPRPGLQPCRRRLRRPQHVVL